MKVNCAQCQRSFNKNPSQIKRSKTGNHFCTRSCAARHNNSVFPKRKAKPKYCKHCSSEIHSGTVCVICSRSVDWNVVTIRDLQKRSKHQKSARIRQLARSVYRKSNRPKFCVHCGYNKTYDVCHIKAINDFPPTATVAQVNNLDNLIALCKNHHWEFDHGLLELKWHPGQDSNL